MMMLIDWLFDNIFVVFILGFFLSWIGKRVKQMTEVVGEQQQPSQVVHERANASVEEHVRRSHRVVEKEHKHIAPSEQPVKYERKAKTLPKHPLVQGVIFSEVLGPPRAKRPFGRK
ncbi:hypothetical protein [Anoxybacillus sp.]|uniref:hypothetical protein n=2 Tax=Anoxybacillus TaxID=150247 RepID=UPI002FE284CE